MASLQFWISIFVKETFSQGEYLTIAIEIINVPNQRTCIYHRKRVIEDATTRRAGEISGIF
jgi:hypothetical protein